MLSLLPLTTLLLHIASVAATPVPAPADADKPCESCGWEGSFTYESERTSRFAHSVSSNYANSHVMPGAVQHNGPGAGSPSGTENPHVKPSAYTTFSKVSATSASGSQSTSTGSSNSSTPDVQGQNNGSSGNSSDDGGLVNPFANPNKTIRATMSVNGKDVTVHGVSAMGTDAYLGIPFAAPPVKDLRWKRPEPYAYGTEVNATQQPVGCMQPPPLAAWGGGAQAPYGQSEDCLTLSVLVPEGTKPDAKLPVMVWIYGGAFTQGSGSIYNSPLLLNYGAQAGQPFVLVTVNYRLGIFGFPIGQDAKTNNAGNLGLHDQIAAFRWVKEHIGSFGGDATRVTGFGESAGAISLSYLMFNETQDLFSAAILQSGAPSTTNTPPLGSWDTEYKTVLSNAGCNDWECLKGVSAEKLLNASNQANASPALVFTPTQDGDIIKGRPFDIVRDGKFADIPFISGNVQNEGTLFLAPNITMPELRTYFKNTGDAAMSNDTWQKILDAYPGDGSYTPPANASAPQIQASPDFPRAATLYGDKSFGSRRRWMLQHAHNKNTTYAFEFAGPYSAFPAVYGVGHGSDVFYLFGWVGVDPRNPKEQAALGYQMMAYWINFAYHHDPNAKPSVSVGPNAISQAAMQPYWPPYAQDKASMLLKPGNVTRISDTFRPQMSVFDEEDVAAASNF